MKSIVEIENMLIVELKECLHSISENVSLDYYNELLGDSSFLLAGLLESQLKKKFVDWNDKKWIDDSLLTKVKINKTKLSIWGIMIWGKEDTTEQWTEPFYFEITFSRNFEKFEQYSFLFGDLNEPAITYEEFSDNRDYWAKNSVNRNWKYIINSNAS